MCEDAPKSASHSVHRPQSASQPLAGAFYVKCCLAVIDSQKLCGLNCSRERPATPGAVACKYGPMTLPQSAKADWGFFFAGPRPAQFKADVSHHHRISP